MPSHNSQNPKCWHSLLEDLPDFAILMLDVNGNVTQWTPGAARIFGYTREEVIGKPGTLLFTAEDVAALVPERELETAKRTGRAEDERWHLRKDGATFWASGITSAVYDSDGKITGFVKIARDLTERKKAQDHQASLLAELERLNRMKDRFLATISHELRTPLAAILGWISLLRSKRLAPDQAEGAIESIERNARHQASLIEDLLDGSRITTGQLKLNVGTVDLGTSLRDAIDAVRFMAEAKKITIDSSIDQAVGTIAGDARRIQQIFWNLLNNAIKFTPSGGHVKVAVRTSGGNVEIHVSDDGQGMAPQFLPHAFDAFRQEQDTTTRSHGGLGLGLAIVKQLAQLHGGDVFAHSDGLGKGSTFTVRLPRHGGGAIPIHRQSSSLPSQNALSGLRVLVVENDPDCRAFLLAAVQQFHGLARSAWSADEALTTLPEFRPGVLLIDLALPDHDGYELLQQVRNLEDDSLANITAIAVTALATDDHRERAMAEGFQAFVVKPVTSEELVAQILRATETVRRRRIA